MKNGQTRGFRASLRDDGTLEMLVYGDIVDTATLSMLEAWGYPTDGFISATAVSYTHLNRARVTTFSNLYHV